MTGKGLSMFISPAYAQAAGADGGSAIATFLPLILIFVVFYVLLIRPQQKKMKQHRAMVEALRRGDKVVTAGGLIGTVSKVVSDSELEVEIAEGVKVKLVRGTVSEVLSKPEPAKASEKKAKGAAPAPANDPGKGSSLLDRFLGGGKKN